MRALILGIAVIAAVEQLPVAYAQQLTDTGMLATGVMSRTRAGGTDFQLGDMMYITALHPANTGGMYVSAHMEFLSDNNNWQPVPTAATTLGNEYRSGQFPGVRDYVKFNSCEANTTRHVCLFMPYAAASLPVNKFYQRRYVLRLWDRNNRPILRTALSAEPVETKRDHSGKLIIVTVKARACGALVGANGDPVPESNDDGTFQFFSTKTGEFICLGPQE